MPGGIKELLINVIYIEMKAFKAYDIRGVYPGDWSKEDAYKIGYFLPRLLKTQKVLVGRDIRLSSDEIFEYLSKGITDSGADVIDMGLSTTPMVYWATVRLGLDASVQITASHNPKGHNGIKVSTRGAMPVGFDTGLNKIQQWMEEEECSPSEKPGKIRNIDLSSEYLHFMDAKAPDLEGLKIAVDCSNGMVGMFIRSLLGDDQIYINEKPDGNFPGHDPNPLNPKNIVQLAQVVRENKCDLGVIFDGDADRVMFVDEEGKFISPDIMIAVLGIKFLDGRKDVRVLQDIRTSKSVGEYLVKMGAEMHTWRVGRAFAVPRLKELKGLYGGELAGHYYFEEFNYSDSGILASLYVLEVLGGVIRKGQTVSSLIRSISQYANSGEKNYIVDDKDTAMQKVLEEVCKFETPEKTFDFDGYRLEFPDWWFNIRPSNTEPYLRFLAEAKNEALLGEKVKMIESVLKANSQV